MFVIIIILLLLKNVQLLLLEENDLSIVRQFPVIMKKV